MTPYHFCYVYVLKSVDFAKLYIGYTSDLRKHVVQHNQGKSVFTNRFKPWQLVYYEAFSNPEAARAREVSLKNNGNPMRELKKRIDVAVDAKVVKGFTLIETMVAVSLLAMAIVAPMSLASQSLASAYYARDQVTAFYLAQEGIEAVRSIRDANILQNSQTGGVNLLTGIPTGQPFVVDTRTNQTWTTCTNQPLKTDGSFYGYGTGPCTSNDPGWTATYFYRTLNAQFVSGSTDEIHLTSTVTWVSGGFKSRTVTVSENLYRWVNDGSGAQ